MMLKDILVVCLFVSIQTKLGVYGAVPDRAYTQKFLPKSVASDFLSRVKRADCPNIEYACTEINSGYCSNDECFCESCIDLCYEVQQKEMEPIYCADKDCRAGTRCVLIVPCFVHFEAECIDIDECESKPCLNGATCHNGDNQYTCTCQENYEGSDCQTDGRCLPRYPKGADLVFLIDSSISTGQSLFLKQIQYIKNFVTPFTIGPADFQVSVITVSSDPVVEFYLDKFDKNSTLAEALDQIQFTAGTSYTGKALAAARDILSSTTRHATRPAYVIVLTDGLSSDSREVRVQSAFFRSLSVHVFAVAFGAQIDHEELLDIAEDYTKVFPPTVHDAVHTLYKNHVLNTCPNCVRKSSDVVILTESSNEFSKVHLQMQSLAIKTLLEVIPISADGVHVSYYQYADELSQCFGFGDYASPSQAIVGSFSCQNLLPGPSNPGAALREVNTNAFSNASAARPDARRIVLLFTSGHFTDIDTVKKEADALKSNNVTLVTIATTGRSSNIAALLELASDPAFVYYVGGAALPYTALRSLTGYMQYDYCDYVNV